MRGGITTHGQYRSLSSCGLYPKVISHGIPQQPTRKKSSTAHRCCLCIEATRTPPPTMDEQATPFASRIFALCQPPITPQETPEAIEHDSLRQAQVGGSADGTTTHLHLVEQDCSVLVPPSHLRPEESPLTGHISYHPHACPQRCLRLNLTHHMWHSDSSFTQQPQRSFA